MLYLTAFIVAVLSVLYYIEQKRMTMEYKISQVIKEAQENEKYYWKNRSYSWASYWENGGR